MGTKNQIPENSGSKPDFRNRMKAPSILVIGLIITCIVTFHTYRNVEIQARKNFESVCDEITIKITARLHSHAQLLRSGAAFFYSSDSVNRKDWAEFISHSKISKNLLKNMAEKFGLKVKKASVAGFLFHCLWCLN